MSAALVAPSLRRRMACWLYEGLLLFAVALVATLVFSVVIQMRHALDPRQWLLQLFLFVVWGVYCGWFWSRGQTLPMRTWRIAVVDRQGRRLTQGRALLRYLFCWIWVLPPIAAFMSRQFVPAQLGALLAGWIALWAAASFLHPQRQFWHDALAGTQLVDADAAGAPATQSRP